LPPFYASVGGRDPIADDTRRLELALERRGVVHEANFAPGQPHAYQAFVWSKAARRTWRESLAFLARVVPAR
jgi:acetyl esterase/lipase